MSRGTGGPKPMRVALRLVLVLLLALGGVTWWALESGGVVVVETTRAEGAPRRTHLWYVRDGEQIWLEAGTPKNGWFVDVTTSPLLTLSGADVAGHYRAVPVHERAARERVRALVREKYGLRDRWVGLVLVDASRSIAVRLDPADP